MSVYCDECHELEPGTISMNGRDLTWLRVQRSFPGIHGLSGIGLEYGVETQGTECPGRGIGSVVVLMKEVSWNIQGYGKANVVEQRIKESGPR